MENFRGRLLLIRLGENNGLDFYLETVLAVTGPQSQYLVKAGEKVIYRGFLLDRVYEIMEGKENE